MVLCQEVPFLDCCERVFQGTAPSGPVLSLEGQLLAGANLRALASPPPGVLWGIESTLGWVS